MTEEITQRFTSLGYNTAKLCLTDWHYYLEKARRGQTAPDLQGAILSVVAGGGQAGEEEKNKIPIPSIVNRLSPELYQMIRSHIY